MESGSERAGGGDRKGGGKCGEEEGVGGVVGGAGEESWEGDAWVREIKGVWE